MPRWPSRTRAGPAALRAGGWGAPTLLFPGADSIEVAAGAAKDRIEPQPGTAVRCRWRDGAVGADRRGRPPGRHFQAPGDAMATAELNELFEEGITRCAE